MSFWTTVEQRRSHGDALRASSESRIWRERENCQTILCSYRRVWLASRNSCSWENWKAFAHEFLLYFPSWILHRIFFRYLNLQVAWHATEGLTLLRSHAKFQKNTRILIFLRLEMNWNWTNRQSPMREINEYKCIFWKQKDPSYLRLMCKRTDFNIIWIEVIINRMNKTYFIWYLYDVEIFLA